MNLKDLHLQISERMRSHFNHITDVARDLDQKCVDRNRAQDQRTDGLVGTIEDHHKRLVRMSAVFAVCNMWNVCERVDHVDHLDEC
eukprot:SAG31_NODE_997_length_10464_cov_16.740473_4_plen_86_part_00